MRKEGGYISALLEHSGTFNSALYVSLSSLEIGMYVNVLQHSQGFCEHVVGSLFFRALYHPFALFQNMTSHRCSHAPCLISRPKMQRNVAIPLPLAGLASSWDATLLSLPSLFWEWSAMQCCRSSSPCPGTQPHVAFLRLSFILGCDLMLHPFAHCSRRLGCDLMLLSFAPSAVNSSLVELFASFDSISIVSAVAQALQEEALPVVDPL